MKRVLNPAGLLLLWLAISAVCAQENPAKSERAFQRACAALAHQPALPPIDGDPWYNASMFGFEAWQPYQLFVDELKGRVLVIAFLTSPDDPAISSMGRWWMKTKRDDMLLLGVYPGGTLAGGLDFVQAAKIPFPFAVDGKRVTASAYGLSKSWPQGATVFVVQRDGKLGAVVYGDFFGARLDLAIARVWLGRDTKLAEDVRVPDEFLSTISPVRNAALAKKITLEIRGMAMQDVLLAIFRKAGLNLLIDLKPYDPPVFLNCRDIPLREALYLLSQEYALSFDWTPSGRMPTAILVSREKEER